MAKKKGTRKKSPRGSDGLLGSSEGTAPVVAEEADSPASAHGEADESDPQEDSRSPDAPADNHGVATGAVELQPHGAAWAAPFEKLDRAWTWFEIRLLLIVIVALVLSLSAWVVLKGMAMPVEEGSYAGITVRSLLGIGFLGAGSYLGLRRFANDLSTTSKNVITGILMLVGGLAGPWWRGVGVEYAEHMLNWLQEGSSLTMVGGLRGVSTRLTVLLALIGGSLAAATGKHINIDVVVRYIPERSKKALLSLITAATLAVCGVAAWGFFDYTSIDGFGANRDWTAKDKYERVSKLSSQNLFLWRKQIGLDLEAMPRVLAGGRWDESDRMNGSQWNQFLEEGGFRKYFTKEEVDNLHASPESLHSPRVPLVVSPSGSARGLLLPLMNFVFPIGFLLLGLRFALRAILVLTGWHIDKEQGAGGDEPLRSEAEK